MIPSTREWTKWIPAFIFAVAVIIVFHIVNNVGFFATSVANFLRVLSPFLFSIIIVYFLYRPCYTLEQLFKKSRVRWIQKKARAFGVLSTYLILALALLVIITIALPLLARSILDFAHQVPTYLNSVSESLSHIFGENYPFSNLDLQATILNFTTYLINFENAGQVFGGVVSVGNGIFNFFISLVFSLYVLLERARIAALYRKITSNLLKPTTLNHLNRYLAQVNRVLFSFIAGKGLDSLINFICVTTILLVFGVEYAFLLGVIAGLANFIPYLGTLFAVIFIAILTLITGGLTQAIWVLAFLLFFQQMDANFIEPKLMSHHLKISPLLVVFSIIVGGAYFGLIGMFLAVPAVTIIKQVFMEYLDLSIEYKKRREKSVRA
ncbi:AI-2E family transporter [Candidatus Saccharibacteria bacterium]|nr:AI-2E family transporter [Candidatus Saccharibacteria bacterium]